MQDVYKKVSSLVEDMTQKKVRSTDLLYTSKLINSMGIIALVVSLEDKFAIKINPNDIIEENFDSIERIVTYVNKAMRLRQKSNDYY